VLAAARTWAAFEAGKHAEVLAIGCFGSYARGDWGVGSDLDLLAIVSHCDEPFERRALGWKVENLPVPAEILIYTSEEWERLSGEKSRFARVLKEDTQWLWSRHRFVSTIGRGILA
jgi:predicted nucleotidyltransferase